MKRFLFLLIFTSVFFQAQEIEELQEGFFFSETSKNFFRVDIKKPYDYYKNSLCDNGSEFRRAQFEGGDVNFSRELFKYISAYVDKEVYVVNGTFFLQIDIDKEGKMTQLNIVPKVENSEMFLRDLKFAVRKIKKTWTPSKCNNIPIDSKLRIKMNFITESADI
ncbi:hypothetical protein [Kaistella polysaccharea]|uniref:hypothetical protein n=1 Tax=Kaistella polysaccharea TaxID=2878534 RepID=UPI001CF405C9|nr:hypothetical protein [Kaistella polysaccharea]